MESFSSVFNEKNEGKHVFVIGVVLSSTCHLCFTLIFLVINGET